MREVCKIVKTIAETRWWRRTARSEIGCGSEAYQEKKFWRSVKKFQETQGGRERNKIGNRVVNERQKTTNVLLNDGERLMRTRICGDDADRKSVV